MQSLTPGAPVFIVSGLASRPDLNGCVAVALEDSPASAGRVAVLVYGPVAAERLALKPTSLQPLPHAPVAASLDWTISVAAPGRRRGGPQIRSTTLSELMAGPIGELDVCDDFFAALLSAVRPSDRPPARLFSREAIRAIVRSPTHDVYWFKFDAIAHYFVLEVHAGHARLFQSSVRARVTTPTGDDFVMGYRPRDWAAPRPMREWPPALRAAHARWGGGRTLSPAELCAFLGALADLQDASEAVIAALLPQLDERLLREEAAAAAELAATEERLRRSKRRGPASVRGGIPPVSAWALEFKRNPSTISHGTEADGSMIVFSNGSYTGARPFCVALPASVARPFQELFTGLTGQAPGGPVIMSMLHLTHWRTLRSPIGPAGAPTGSEAVGWGFFETIHWRK